MTSLKDITPLQIIASILIVNGVLAGSLTQLTDLLGPVWANHVLSIAVIGSGICGGFVMSFGGQSAMVKQVAAMQGVQSISVNSEANKTLAQIAVSSAADAQKIEAAPGTASLVAAIAKSGV